MIDYVMLALCIVSLPIYAGVIVLVVADVWTHVIRERGP
jgi:hypothetical protein